MYLGCDEELWNGEAAGSQPDSLALAHDRRPRPAAAAAGVRHAGGHLLAEPYEDMAAVVQDSCRVCARKLGDGDLEEGLCPR